MLDELREQADYSEEDENEVEVSPEPTYYSPAYDDHHDHFLGMSPGQRLIIAFMLFLVTFFLGVFFLLITGRIVLPALI